MRKALHTTGTTRTFGYRLLQIYVICPTHSVPLDYGLHDGRIHVTIQTRLWFKETDLIYSSSLTVY